MSVTRQSGRVPVLTLVVVVALVAGLAVGTGVLWSKGSLNELICDGDCGPSAIATPDVLARDGVPGTSRPRSAGAARLNPAAVEAAVRDELSADDLGSRVGFAAVDPADGTVVASSGEGAYVPASTTKVLTGIAALAELDPQSRFVTRVVRKGDRIVLEGGGDPYLVTRLPRENDPAVRADLATLAKRTAAALKRIGTTEVGLDYETSLFTGPSASPGWEPSYLTQRIVTPVSALTVDGGTVGGTRVDFPAKATAEVFARLLQRRGITVNGSPIETKAPYTADPIAAVSSATVAQIVEAMVARSDNEAAEILLRHAAIAAGQPATFEGGATAVRGVLTRLEVDVGGLELQDGSGLSRQNRIAPVTLAEAVAASAGREQLAGLVSGLPIARFTGTLIRRFGEAGGGRGVVRAKTGTLTGVHSLAGFVTDRSGTPIAFAAMADRTKSVSALDTEAALDRVAAALADCPCSGPVP